MIRPRLDGVYLAECGCAMRCKSIHGDLHTLEILTICNLTGCYSGQDDDGVSSWNYTKEGLWYGEERNPTFSLHLARELHP